MACSATVRCTRPFLSLTATLVSCGLARREAHPMSRSHPLSSFPLHSVTLCIHVLLFDASLSHPLQWPRRMCTQIDAKRQSASRCGDRTAKDQWSGRTRPMESPTKHARRQYVACRRPAIPQSLHPSNSGERAYGSAMRAGGNIVNLTPGGGALLRLAFASLSTSGFTCLGDSADFRWLRWSTHKPLTARDQ